MLDKPDITVRLCAIYTQFGAELVVEVAFVLLCCQSIALGATATRHDMSSAPLAAWAVVWKEVQYALMRNTTTMVLLFASFVNTE